MPPRRGAARAVTLEDPSSSAQAPSDPFADELRTLRTNWKWANFCQFFFTFSQLLGMDDVTVNDIEDDLVRGSSIVLPRIMTRLLYTLSYDRKVNLDNWQTVLRKQYNKRDPFANPIGSEPSDEPEYIRSSSIAEEVATPDQKIEEGAKENGVKNETNTPAPESTRDNSAIIEDSKAPSIVNGDVVEHLPKLKKSAGAVKLLSDAQVAELETRESKNWLDLPMLEKLDSMHLLSEWQFQNATRLRTLMKTDDDTATWRIEPIGYDAKSNAYWLIGADRLWIQRVPPKPPRTSPSKTLKRKRTTDAKTPAKSKHANKRPRIQSQSQPQPKGKAKAKAVEEVSTPSGRGRAAKAQANLKLDQQAKQLEQYKKEAAALSSRRSGRGKAALSSSPPRPLGTRLSARLRGTQEEEWQPIPEEWLNGNENDEDYEEQAGRTSKNKKRKTGLESDDGNVSDLTELTEEAENVNQDEEEEGEATEGPGPEFEPEPEPEVDNGVPEELPLPEGFVEWETICVTLHEWEHIAERWEKATHYTEKSLYKVLTKTIVPVITEELREIERKRKLEEAVTHRKRSSRIAIKETVKEEAKAEARKRAEQEEKMSRSKRAEARHLKEEQERQRRESGREQRRKEREAREAKEAEAKAKQDAEESMDVDVVGNTNTAKTNGTGGRQRHVNGTGTRTPKGEDWELDCEICHRKGLNLDDGTPMMCCGICNRWQHIACHDYADAQARRPRRDWEKVDFICRQCHPQGYRENSLNVPPSSNPYASYAQSYGGGSYQLASKGHTPHQPVSDLRSQASTGAYSSAANGLSFSHYQPQQRGFSSGSSTQPYQATQSYGQLPSQAYAANGHRQRYAPSSWNVTTQSGLPPAPTYPSTERGGSVYSPPVQPYPEPPPLPSIPQWQGPRQQYATPSPSISYHSPSYQTPTS